MDGKEKAARIHPGQPFLNRVVKAYWPVAVFTLATSSGDALTILSTRAVVSCQLRGRSGRLRCLASARKLGSTSVLAIAVRPAATRSAGTPGPYAKARE